MHPLATAALCFGGAYLAAGLGLAARSLLPGALRRDRRIDPDLACSPQCRRAMAHARYTARTPAAERAEKAPLAVVFWPVEAAYRWAVHCPCHTAARGTAHRTVPRGRSRRSCPGP
ncbi:hypothetical protein J0910_30570 [Nocardiopsis sp. CNT-189]|uniref:hypothetical protein n=1 Tax=Nocardiopsis oceanisediminis TaxID=2816862 RepID=UPI003B3947A1